jgi:hypothetical protein
MISSSVRPFLAIIMPGLPRIPAHSPEVSSAMGHVRMAQVMPRVF